MDSRDPADYSTRPVLDFAVRRFTRGAGVHALEMWSNWPQLKHLGPKPPDGHSAEMWPKSSLLKHFWPRPGCLGGFASGFGASVQSRPMWQTLSQFKHVLPPPPPRAAGAAPVFLGQLRFRWPTSPQMWHATGAWGGSLPVFWGLSRLRWPVSHLKRHCSLRQRRAAAEALRLPSKKHVQRWLHNQRGLPPKLSLLVRCTTQTY